MRCFALCCVLACAFCATVRSDVAIYPETITETKFVVPTNTVALISMIKPAPLKNGQAVTVICKGEQFTAQMGYGARSALEGPFEIRMPNGGYLLQFQMLSNSTFQTIVAKPSTLTTIEVPEGKILHFMSNPLAGSVDVIYKAVIERAGFSINVNEILPDDEFEGPTTITFNANDTTGNSTYALPITYFLADRATVIPSGAIVQSGTGNFEIQIEKSTNLQTWTPAVVVPITSSGKAFYRMNVSR